MASAMDIEQARFNMVEQQIRTWDVLDQGVLDLLFSVRREDFVPPQYRLLAFADLEIPLGDHEKMWAPKMEARVLQELQIEQGESVLEIGTGSGYLTALLARMAGQVTSVEINPRLAAEAKAKLARAGLGSVERQGRGRRPRLGPRDVRCDRAHRVDPRSARRVHRPACARGARVRGRRRAAGDAGAARALGGAGRAREAHPVRDRDRPAEERRCAGAFRVLIPQLAPAELVRWRADASREPPVVVDVREPWEFEYCRIDGSLLIPLGELPRRAGELPRERTLVMVCHTGRRSQHAAMFLERAGFADVQNLEGGVERWAVEIDPAMKRY